MTYTPYTFNDRYSKGFSGATVQISDQLKHYSLICSIANIKCAHLGEVTLEPLLRFSISFNPVYIDSQVILI